MLAIQVQMLNFWARTRLSLIEHPHRFKGDDGQVSDTVIIIAILCTLAISVGAIIVAKVTQKANDIPMQ